MYYEMSYERNENVVSLSAPATSTPSFPLQLWIKRDILQRPILRVDVCI